MKIPTILGALLLAGTLSAGAQMNSDSLYKDLIVLSIISVRRRAGLVTRRDSCTIKVNIICTGGVKSNLQIWYITNR